MGGGVRVAEYAFLHFPQKAVPVDPVRLARMPLSAQRVFAACEAAGPLTAAQLRERTGMPARTVRYAVQRLREEGVMDTRCSLRDCRTCFFFVHGRCDGVAALDAAREARPNALPMAL